MDYGAGVATVVIDRRFNGPEHSSNGGYACGSVAAFIDGPAEVTLRVPPPLDTETSSITTRPSAARSIAIRPAALTAIDPLDESGEVVAAARATWIEPR